MVTQIAQHPEADRLLDDNPFALLVGMLLDQQYPMEHAFAGPWRLASRFGPLDVERIAAADPEEFVVVCSTTPAVHRYPRSMAGRIQAVAAHLVEHHGGRTERLWTEASDGADLLRRLKALPGFGDQKARIFVALLAKQRGVTPDGWQRAAGNYAQEGHQSVADVTGPESLARVREFKQAKKRAAKAQG